LSCAEKPLVKGAQLSEQEFCAFSVSDALQLYNLDRSCLLSPWTFEGFRDELGHEYSHCWGRRDPQHGIIDAFILSHIILDEAHLLKIGVAVNSRKRGIGGRLLEYAIERYRELGVKYVHLEMRRSNQIAKKFYQSFGFIENGIRPNYYGREEGYEQVSEDAILYLKRI
jgi:ribosomal-protein-alanine N-acetyltransferase